MSGGGLESQKVPDLLFWLMFAIGTEGSIIPNRNITRTVVNKKTKKKVTKKFNPTKIVMNAMVSCLEMLWCVKVREMKQEDIPTILQNVVNIANFHAMALFDLKQFLCGSSNKMGAVKMHLWSHAPRFFAMFGALIYSDTNTYEHDHIADKRKFNRTSKNYDTMLQELLRVVSYCIRSNKKSCVTYS
jgi:hypothetical protein